MSLRTSERLIQVQFTHVSHAAFRRVVYRAADALHTTESTYKSLHVLPHPAVGVCWRVAACKYLQLPQVSAACFVVPVNAGSIGQLQ
jgi:hypothetical protein